jgi:hypothetical protein
LTAADVSASNVSLQYGVKQCDDSSGCDADVMAVTTKPRMFPTAAVSVKDPSACWHRLGDAVVFACAGAGDLYLWSGSVQYHAQGEFASTAAWRRIQPFNAAAREQALARPTHFTCAEAPQAALEQRPEIASGMPEALRPVGC